MLKKDLLTMEVVNYAGFEIVFKSYSVLIFGHTRFTLLCYSCWLNFNIMRKKIFTQIRMN